MYQYKGAVSLTGNSWTEEDVSTRTFNDLYKSSKKVYLNVFETLTTAELSIDLDDLKSRLYYSQEEVGAFLVANGDNALPTHTGYRKLTRIKRQRYNDIANGDFDLQPTVVGLPPDPTRPLYKSPDLAVKMVNPKATPIKASNSIAVVGGIACLMRDGPDRTEIHAGYLTMTGMEDNLAGFVTFDEIADVYQVRLDDSDISDSDNGFLLRTPVEFDEKDIVMVSIGGALYHTKDAANTLRAIGSRTVVLNEQYVSWIDIILNTRFKLDLTYLGLTDLAGFEKAVVLDEVLGKEVQRKLLKGLNSFIVVIKSKDRTQPIAVDTQYFYDLGTECGKYCGGNRPTAGLMRNALGFPVNYTLLNNDGEYVLSTNQFSYHAPVYKTTDYLKSQMIDNTRDQMKSYRISGNMMASSFYQLAED